MASIKVKRIYEPFDKADGFRVLVDRLWPRGIKKDEAHIDVCLKDVAPSTQLRKWFNHDPAKWKEFQKAYTAELKDSDALKELFENITLHKKITLLFSAHDEQHNHALVLQKFIKKSNF